MNEVRAATVRVLNHYSHERLFQWFDWKRPGDILDENTRRVKKPGGFWLSDDSGKDGWISACQRVYPEEYAVRYRYRHECIVALDGVLWLKTRYDMERFNSNYGVVDKPGGSQFIDWNRVRADYRGILIIPFHRDLSHQEPSYHWYIFDCASGCIWNSACLLHVKPGVKTRFPERVP